MQKRVFPFLSERPPSIISAPAVNLSSRIPVGKSRAQCVDNKNIPLSTRERVRIYHGIQ